VRLIFIHGPPAVGKLTVARELAELIFAFAPERTVRRHSFKTPSRRSRRVAAVAIRAFLAREAAGNG